MKIFLIDTEYLSWNKNQSLNNPKLRSKYQPPEIIQVFIKEIFTYKKREKLIYVKPTHYRKYPYRISNLTKINKNFLNNHGISFDEAYKIIVKFIPEKSLIISNGDEYKILDSNLKINKIKKTGKKVFFFDFFNLTKNNKLFNKVKKKFISTDVIKNILRLKIVNHNAYNDVKILLKCMKKIKLKKSHLNKYKTFYKLHKI